LNVSHCTSISEEGAIFFVNNFPDIQLANFDGIQWVGEAFVNELTTKHKETLTDVFLDGEDLSDLSIETLASCTNLKTLSIYFSNSLTPVSLDYIKTFQNLSHLTLRKGVNFTNASLLSFLEHLSVKQNANPCNTGLTSLSLAECNELSDKCLFFIAEGCPNLESIDLSWCWEVTDNGIAFIIDGCRRMRRLELCGLHELYGWPFRNIPVKMPKLEFLDLRQCNRIQDELAVELVAIMDSITILNYYGDTVRTKVKQRKTDIESV